MQLLIDVYFLFYVYSTWMLSRRDAIARGACLELSERAAFKTAEVTERRLASGWLAVARS